MRHRRCIGGAECRSSCLAQAGRGHTGSATSSMPTRTSTWRSRSAPSSGWRHGRFAPGRVRSSSRSCGSSTRSRRSLRGHGSRGAAALRWSSHRSRTEELRSLLGDRLLVLDDELMVDDYEHQLARLWDFLALPAVSVASQEPKRSSRDGWRGAPHQRPGGAHLASRRDRSTRSLRQDREVSRAPLRLRCSRADQRPTACVAGPARPGRRAGVGLVASAPDEAARPGPTRYRPRSHRA